MTIINQPISRFSRMELRINILDTFYTPQGFYDVEIKTRFQNLTDPDKVQVLNGFIRYLAVTMRKMLKSSIKSQYYKYKWKPLNPAYLKFKKAHGLSENIWQATGKLYKSISYRKVGNYYIVGINPRATYENGTSVFMVAACMEYGSKNMPARPLFTPVLNYIKSNIKLYWRLYISNPREYVTQRIINKMKRS